MDPVLLLSLCQPPLPRKFAVLLKVLYIHLPLTFEFDHVTCFVLCSVTSVRFDSVTLWTIASQTPLSMSFSRQEYCSGLPCPPPGDLPDPGIKPKSFKSPVWQVDPLLLAPPGKPKFKPTFFQVASPLLDLIESFGETKSQASNKDFPQSSQVSIEKLRYN